MDIRKLTIDDYEEIVRLWSRAELPFKPNGRDSRQSVASQIEADPEFFLGAFQDGRLVGTVVLSSDLRRGWINRLAVDPEFRNRGIATALIAESETVLRKQGLRIFCALVEAENIVSRELFKNRGYVEHHDILYFSKRESDEV